MRLSHLKKSIEIFEKYMDPDTDDEVSLYQEYIFMCSYEKLSKEDLERVKKLGWHWDDEAESWKRFV